MRRLTGPCAVLAMLAAGWASTAQGPTAPGRPSLLVILVVDQMRYEYLDRYQRLWTSGVRRLLEKGAVFERAFYPYLNTVTCAGHATIGTGALPATHGIIMNEWWQRSQGRRMSCTDDPAVTSLPYTPPAEPIGHSAYRLKVPTLAERLRAASPTSRVVSLSMKPRSTVMMAGKGGTAVTWFADSNVWATSTAYASALVPEVAAFVREHPVDRERDVVWTRARDLSVYSGEDQVSAERPPNGRARSFPHPLAGVSGTAASRFYDLWERSPYSDAYLGEMAAALTRSFALGQRGVVDLLAVSFSAVDYVGHDFGPDSHELQDTLIRVDATIGRLLDALDTTVGRGRYVVGLSADHGVAQIPELMAGAGQPSGRVINAEVRKVAEAAMTAAYGPGPHVAHVEYSNLYLTDAARAHAAADPRRLAPILEAVGKMPGVLRVMRASDVQSLRDSADPVERAAALSAYPGESGEVFIVLQPNWIGTNTSAATHGSHHPYDQHVPLVFLGAGIKAGRFDTPASPADLAPTLAALVPISIPGVEGRVLRPAIAGR